MSNKKKYKKKGIRVYLDSEDRILLKRISKKNGMSCSTFLRSIFKKVCPE